MGWASLLAIEQTEVELPPAADIQVDFQGQIEPILKGRCQACHGAQQQGGGLRLDGREAALTGGYSGAVIVPGNSGVSRLIHLISGHEASDENPVMPMVGDRLTDEQVGLFRAWIDQGVEWTEGASRAKKSDLQPEASGQTHWAFISPAKSPIPRVGNRGWVKNPIDAFVLERLEEEDIDPSPEADPATLIRRLSLDLLGLPPTPAQVDAFLADTDPDAYGRLVDQLLDSPRREVGSPMARPGTLRRQRRLRKRPRQTPCLALAPLGDRGLEPQPALRPVHYRADRRRPSSECKYRAEGGDWLLSPYAYQPRGGHASGAEA